ncbi:MAG TPA: hypothetical protein VKG43_05220 [Acidimicrobiales bacterium]|nr:hypothetical protein [Acidimicrobiales bacterium]
MGDLQEPGQATPGQGEAWAAHDEAALVGDAAAAEEDEERRSGWAEGHPGRWNPFRREHHNVEVLDAGQDAHEAAFEREVASELQTGAISVPAGGPVTPEEEMWVLEHPWPGHTNREAIERERAARAGTTGPTATEPPPPPPG